MAETPSIVEPDPVDLNPPAEKSKDRGEGKRGNRTAKLIRGGISSCRRVRRELLVRWQDNVAFRVGRPFTDAPEDDTINVPADWARTKNKQAQLFVQCPDAKLRARNPRYQGTGAVASSALNFELQERIHAEHAFDECSADVVNAAGLCIARVSYTAVFDDPQPMPLFDVPGASEEEIAQMIEAKLIPTEDVEQILYEGFGLDRVSPGRFLWPIEHRGSNWQKSPWLGHEGYLSVEEAKRRGWVDDDYEGEEIETDELLADDELELRQLTSGKYIKYVEVFYRASFYDAKERHPHKIKRMVLIESKQEDDTESDPVVDEDFEWQRWVPATPGSEAIPPSPENPQGVPAQPARPGRYIGMIDFPLKVRTLTTVSDLAIPPSDSEMGRPQVKEMIRARSHIIQQMAHSLPIRWFDVNRVDDEIAALLRAGVMQDMIPMNGPGTDAIGEVARANYPRENFEFMRIFNSDLDETWSMGPNQMGIEAPGDQSATEAKIVQSSGNVKLEYERAKFLSFILECYKGIFSLMQLFSDFEDYIEVIGEDGVRTLQRWNKDTIPCDYIFEAKPDAAVRVDVNQKKQEMLNVYKLLRRDPLINPQAIILELLELYGYDPSRWVAKPQPPKAEKPNIRYSFKGEDMITAIALARMQKQDDGPLTEQDIEAAKKLIGLALELVPAIAAAVPGAVNDPTAAARQKAEKPAQSTGHPGPAPTVQPLNRRYETSDDAAGTVTNQP